MFSFFKKKSPPPEATAAAPVAPDAPSVDPVDGEAAAPAAPERAGWLKRWLPGGGGASQSAAEVPTARPATVHPTPGFQPPAPPVAETAPPVSETVAPTPDLAISDDALATQALAAAPAEAEAEEAAATPTPASAEPERSGWFSRLKQGLRKTGSSLAQVFTGAKIDEALYEELESALLMADAGVGATQFLLDDLRRRVKDTKATEPQAVKGLLVDAVTDLLRPLEKALVIGQAQPTVIMVAGVNGAGKTTSIGKLTRYLAGADQRVLLAAADTFRAAAREQLSVWADRNRVDIVSQEGGDPAAVTFDAVSAGRARACDVVIADTAGRLPTQMHLMEELKKIHRVIGKAMPGAPHEVLLVVDGNTGQNALAQVKSFDAALGLTGLIVTKLDGTAKGGVLAAIARWCAESRREVPVYFIGIGEKLEDLQTFNAREFAEALLAQ